MADGVGYVCTTEDEIRFHGLLSLRGRVSLEMRGMRCRGRSASAIAKDMFHMPQSARRAKVLARIDEEIEAMKVAKRAENAKLQEGDSDADA